jgi:hypothetical protein
LAFLPTATARLIYARLGRQIQQACEGTGVPPAFLAALISLENAPLRAGAGRFEPKVFRALRLVRLGLPRLTKRGLVRDYNGITRQDLTGLTLPQLRLLATSWGYTQVMGWWTIPLRCRISDLQSPQTHLPIAVRLLELVAGARAKTDYLKAGNYEACFRVWNTGSPTGKTHDPRYAPRGLAVLAAYAELLKQA